MIKLKTKDGYFAFTCENCPKELINQKWAITVKRGVPYLVRGLWIPKKNITKMQYFHRLITSAQKGQFVDHINGNTLDNRLENLRLCSNTQNVRNSKIPKTNTTGYKGINYVPRNPKKPWSARIAVNGKGKHLGYFKTKEEAALAYNKAASLYYGEFAKLNEVKINGTSTT